MEFLLGKSRFFQAWQGKKECIEGINNLTFKNKTPAKREVFPRPSETFFPPDPDIPW
jgi:hypothetical protein